MDIDIDCPRSFIPTDVFNTAVAASMVKGGELVKHPCGCYFQSIPKDPVTNLAAIPCDRASELNYIKIDFLHLSLLDKFTSKEEVRALIKTEPDWSLLQNSECVATLFQLGKHYDLVRRTKPRSIIELADCICLIRPAKRHLVDAYIQNKERVRPMLYRQKDDDKSSFRKGHAIAYAMTVVLQMHLIKQGRLPTQVTT